MAKARKRSETASSPDNSPSTAVQDPPSATTEYPHDRIRARAYELYLQRGGGDGRDFDDWLAAERELGVGAETPQAEDYESGE